MADNDTPENEKKRVEIGDLPQEEKELTDEEAKKIEGGVGYGTIYNPQPQGFPKPPAPKPGGTPGGF